MGFSNRAVQGVLGATLQVAKFYSATDNGLQEVLLPVAGTTYAIWLWGANLLVDEGSPVSHHVAIGIGLTVQLDALWIPTQELVSSRPNGIRVPQLTAFQFKSGSTTVVAYHFLVYSTEHG